MSDEEFDSCEWVWNNQFAMQRLLSILRQTQNYCADNECFSFSRLPGSDLQPTSNFFFPCLILGIVALMFVLRPNSLRQVEIGESKAPDGSGSSDGPPAPPTAN